MSRRLALMIFLALLGASGLPQGLVLGAEDGFGAAFARGGEDSDDDKDDDSDDDRDDDSDDDRDDDSGSGGGSDDDSDDDSGGGDDSGGDDSDDDGGATGGGSTGGSTGGGSAVGGSSGGKASGGSSNADRDIARDLFTRDTLSLIYNDGTSERISKGRYERLDRRGRVIERRNATSDDRARLGRMDRSARKAGAQTVVSVNTAQRKIQIIDVAGWRETLEGSRYQLTDPNGNVVTRRTATAKDIARLRQTLGQH